MIKMQEKVILVDETDVPIGEMEKMEAHYKGLLHRAISVFVVDTNGNWLIQQRTLEKYHSRGLWSNSCCSHPTPGEMAIDAASRRLMQEMGLKASLEHLFTFTYKALLENGLIEHETDHVFVGITDVLPRINHHEVGDYKYISYQKLHEDVSINPGKYSEWFKLIYQRVNTEISKKNLLTA